MEHRLVMWYPLQSGRPGEIHHGIVGNEAGFYADPMLDLYVAYCLAQPVSLSQAHSSSLFIYYKKNPGGRNLDVKGPTQEPRFTIFIECI